MDIIACENKEHTVNICQGGNKVTIPKYSLGIFIKALERHCSEDGDNKSFVLGTEPDSYIVSYSPDKPL